MSDPLHQLEPQNTEAPNAQFVEALRARIEGIEARATTPGDTMSTEAAAWHLAELNLGVFNAPLDSPEMAEFVNALDRINTLADEAPGFIWRMKDDDGGPSSYVEVPGVDDPLLASNLSVWEDYESLREYMYRTDHAAYLRRRSDWFQHNVEVMTVGWWVPAGTIPTLEDAMRRLQHLRDHGPTDTGWPLTRPWPLPVSVD